MPIRPALLTLAAFALLASTPQAAAQAAAEKTEEAKPARKRAAAERQKSPKQLAAGERQKKCSAEWKEAKAAGKTESLKWPQFYSRCNARMKGREA